MTNDEIPKYPNTQLMTKDEFRMTYQIHKTPQPEAQRPAKIAASCVSSSLRHSSFLGYLGIWVFRHSSWVLGYFVISLSLSLAAPLDDQITAFKSAPAQTEAAVSAILQSGIKEARSAQAYAAVKAWLTTQPALSPKALFEAGQVAERAGEWADAVGFYRKLLNQPTLDAGLAAEAVPTTYLLLINHLGDPEGAYLHMREAGDRLRAYGRARQFDAWFIEQAKSRADVPALCRRLATILTSDAGNVAAYAGEFEWICAQLETLATPDEAWFEAAGKLAALPNLPAEYKARIGWAMAILPFTKEATELFRAKKPIPETLLDKPRQAAEALLAASPHEGAIIVARGWMNFRDSHTPNLLEYVAQHREIKTAPLLKTLAGLSPSQAQSVFVARGCPQGRPVSLLFSASDMRALVPKAPAIFNTLAAVDVPLVNQALTVEEARVLAPHLARNPHPQAAVVRAVAAAGSREPNLLVPALLKSEAWRFTTTKDAITALVTHGLIPEGSSKRFFKQHPEEGVDQLATQVQKSAKPEDRRAAFDKISKELLTPAPTTRALLKRWGDLFTLAPETEKSAMLKSLADNLQGDGEMLFRFTLDVSTINNAGRLPWRPVAPANHSQYHQEPTRKGVADFLAHVEKLLRQQMQAGNISETIFGVWLHSTDPRTPESQALLKDLLNSPATAKIDPAYLRVAADSSHFGDLAKPSSAFAAIPKEISRELVELPPNATPAQVEAAFKAVTDRLPTTAQPVAPIALHKVAQLPEWSAQTRALAAGLFGKNLAIGPYPPKQGWEPMVLRATKDLQAAKQWGEIEPWAAGLWHAAAATDDERTYDAAEALIKFAEAALEAGAPSPAMTIARGGLRSTAIKNLTARNEPKLATMVARLQKTVGKAAGAIGAFEIPVDETDPSFPIYQSQAEFVQGNLDSAWDLYTAHAAKLPDVLRQLPVDYSFWLLQRNMETNRAQDAEALIKELTIWSRQAEGTFTAEQDARLKIAYADLAMRKGAYPTARAWYRRVADAAEYQGTEMYLLAALGSVKVDRVSKNYSSAMTELDKLAKLTNPAFRSRVSYARAEVLMDQESYQEALAEIETVLRREPKHPDALLLQGRINFFMRKLVEASEIELGPSETDTVIVPGEAVKINLRDPTLRVSGMGADIEVEIWAKSGDRERVMLYQLGDSKDKFRAEIPTALGPATPGDKILQILGKDEIRFGYSKEFRAKMKDLPADPDTVIAVASDAFLAVSAGAFPPREGERRLAIEELGLSSSQAALGTRSVRPGNPIFIRVTDADRSITSGQDEIAVSITTSSGDEIRQLPLKETSPFSGEFEATVPTSGGQALAFASDSAPGRDPNMAISSRDYPGWQGEAGKKDATRIFGIDLNDNAAPSTMTIETGGAGSSLTHFVFQTSMSGTNWKTGVRFPSDPAPWDGRPQISSIATFGTGMITVSDPMDRQLPADWKESMELKSARPGMKYLAAHVSKLSDGKLSVVETSHPGYSALVRFRALFYQPAAAVRRFELAGLPGSDGKTINTIFLLDGQPAGPESDNPFSITRELAPGLHEIEFWHREGRDSFLKRRPVLLCDEPGKQELVPCPDSMFDPAGFPDGLRAQLPEPPVITTAAPGKFNVAFGKNTQTRLVRMVIQGFEGVAPTITKVKLTDRAGATLIPVAGDFLELRQNSQLEVLPGDQINVRYIDPVTATPRRDRHEGRLTAAFNTGILTASFLNYETNKEGERVLVLEPIRRFRHDDAVAIVVDDADLDGGPTRDTVDIKIKSSAGAEITIKAVETEEQSGRFIGRVFPVKGKPERESEINLPEGGTLTAIYRDAENLDPGIPTDRSVTITQAKYGVPGLQAYAMESEALPPPPPSKKSTSGDGKITARASTAEVVRSHRNLKYVHLDEQMLLAEAPEALIGAELRFDVVVPHMALAPSSTINAYVQTEAARKAAPANGAPFDISLPGTLKLTGKLQSSVPAAPTGYVLAAQPLPPTNMPALEEGRFAFSLPLILGEPPVRSFATKDAEALPDSALPDGLAVKAGDVVHVAYAWKDAEDKVQWKSARFTVGSHALLDVMQSGYAETMDSAFVGERVYIRLLAPGLDRGPDRDSAEVTLKSSGGLSSPYELRETEAHSGIFKGAFTISFADEAGAAAGSLPSIALNGFPVRYGDSLGIMHLEDSREITINKGADGQIEPFSKRFAGDEMAVRTGFTLAECYFELAKKHREMEQESLARREIGQARKLLAEALATHRDEDLKAQAEYLLGNLSQEFADLAKNDESRQPMYLDALARFSKIPTDYPDTEFAPKAQFKTALVYEKLGETENAVEEYVKLAYKYPNHELIPTVMARLGGYFQQRGSVFKEKADPLRENKDDASIAEVLRLDEMSYPDFLNAAMIFSKLQERFPQDPLAGLSGIRAAQNFMRAHQYERAVAGLKRVIENEEYDGPDIRSQALYWSGLSHERLPDGRGGNQLEEAYQLYRRITYDFPDSQWAKYARGRLADPAFESRILRDNEARQRMIDSIKEEKKKR